MCVPSTGPHLMACSEGKRAQLQCCVEVDLRHGELSKQTYLRVWGWLGPEERVDRGLQNSSEFEDEHQSPEVKHSEPQKSQKQWHPYLSSQRSYRETRGRQKKSQKLPSQRAWCEQQTRYPEGLEGSGLRRAREWGGRPGQL